MRLLIACDKFKGTLSALEVGQALAAGLWAARPELDIRIRAASDGGEGLLEALAQPLKLIFHAVPVRTPEGALITAALAQEPAQGRVWIESALAIGHACVPPAARHPLRLNSAGLGDLIRAALALDPPEIWIGLGSSATVDGGLGLATALGWQLRDSHGQPLPLWPEALPQLAQLHAPDPPLPLPPITALCDVRNPLLGPGGGVAVYSAQKGATPAEIRQLEAALAHWCRFLPGGDPDSHATRPHGGAAGGLGLACATLLGAELVSGAEAVIAASGLATDLDWAEAIITGEGAFDAQSLWGKWPQALIARAAGKPLGLITGQPLHGPLPAGVQWADHLLRHDPTCADSPAASQAALQAIGRHWALTEMWRSERSRG
jgi:glycerate kinase